MFGMKMRFLSSRSAVGSVNTSENGTVSFVERFALSDQFDHIFREGMALVEETAAYLDGAGRQAARELNPALAVVYATESMRLTTRLLELATWLLIRRSIKTGEITAEEARVKRRRLRLKTIGRPAHVKGFPELPSGLRDLVEASFAFNDRIVRIDVQLEKRIEIDLNAVPNPVGRHIETLNEAFGASATRH
jgi:regulator of CtrA degradation